ncbi:MAG: hypothetical protein R2704_18445 [Microthrixaceae bacterium]
MCNFGLQIDLAKEDGKRLRLDREADALTVDRLSSDRAAERVAESGVNMGGVRALRVGRGFGLYRPFDTANLEADEGLQAPGWLANVQAIQWLGVMAIASAGAITARRRGMPLAHVLGLIVAAVVAMALGFGASRYRAALDPAFAMLAGAGAVAIADSWRSGRRAKKVVGGEYKPGLEGSAGGSSARFE